ncbi:MAG: hypothetical protein A4E64_01133 [Syntrophorhabdus sp. PtaU1.Bin058]|nr:MAG: hypothetical protein A4E64_01133 [Syntrophorhabdus sp. PtaU1.Bin058]
MAVFKVIFRNRLNSSGEPFELPADKLNANGVIIESYEYIKREIRDGEDFARELWEYEVPDKDADRFAVGLDSTPTIIEYKKE